MLHLAGRGLSAWGVRGGGNVIKTAISGSVRSLSDNASGNDVPDSRLNFDVEKGTVTGIIENGSSFTEVTYGMTRATGEKNKVVSPLTREDVASGVGSVEESKFEGDKVQMRLRTKTGEIVNFAGRVLEIKDPGGEAHVGRTTGLTDLELKSLNKK